MGLESLFLEEAGTFGEGRRFLPEGQRGGEPVRGVGRKEGRKSGRVREEPVTLQILDWTPVNGRKLVSSAARALGALGRA